MSQSLGEKLRQAREERGISVSEVAEQTRISPLYIKAIENDDYKPLPGGIFNKGFVRSYARYVGFDEEEALRDYSEMVSVSGMQADADQTVHRSEVWTDDRSARSFAPTIIFAVIILGLLIGGVLLLVRYVLQPGGSTTSANANLSTAASPSNNAIVTPGATETQPVSGLTVDLRALNEPVWVAYTVDGSRTEKTLDAGQSVKLEPQDNVKLSFARVKASSLEIAINGRKVDVRTATTKGSFDIDIDKSNAQQLLQNGIGEAAAAQPPTPATVATPRPSPRPSLPAANRPPATSNTAAPRRTP